MHLGFEVTVQYVFDTAGKKETKYKIASLSYILLGELQSLKLSSARAVVKTTLLFNAVKYRFSNAYRTERAIMNISGTNTCTVTPLQKTHLIYFGYTPSGANN